MGCVTFDTCCGCFTLRTGSLIIGYVQLVSMITVNVLLLWSILRFAVVATNNVNNEDIQFFAKYMMVVCGVLLFFTGLSLTFVVTLLVGVHLGKRGHVKAYLMYSLTFLVIAVVAFLISFGAGKMSAVYIGCNIVHFMISIYVLLVINSFYLKMDQEMRGNNMNDLSPNNCKLSL